MYSEIVILAMLSNQPMHGYEIKKSVEQVLSVSLNNKVLYPTLKRFEEMHAVGREVVRQEGKPDKHMYSITEHGRELLQMLLQDDAPELLRNDSEFLVRVSMFALLEPEIRLAILRTRAGIVTERIQHIQAMRILASDGKPMPFAQKVITFNEQQHQRELEWIQSLMHHM